MLFSVCFLFMFSDRRQPTIQQWQNAGRAVRIQVHDEEGVRRARGHGEKSLVRGRHLTLETRFARRLVLLFWGILGFNSRLLTGEGNS